MKTRQAGKGTTAGQRRGAAAALALLLTACASYGPGDLRVGDDEAAVVRSMGAPAARYAMPEGVTRLAYARGPFGKHTYMVDLGRDGRVLRWHQALGEEPFARVAIGTPEDELLRTLGPPSHREWLGRGRGEVWSWRYPTLECHWWRVTLDASRRVVDAGYGTDPVCEIINDTP